MSSLLHRPLPLLLGLLTVAAPLVACDEYDAELDAELAADDADDDDDVGFRGGIGCAKCQFNSAAINGFPISSLDLSGGANDHGVAVRFLRDPDGNTYTLGVLDEELAAYDGGQLRAHGEQLLKWEIVLDVAGSEQSLFVVGRKQIGSLRSGAAPLGVYALAGAGGSLANVCPEQEFGAATVTILHGETYDAERKTVDKIGEQWITLACVDEAAFKLKRLGYGPRGTQGPDGKHPTLAQRITTLKMLTADYCGTGQSFTAPHVAVGWMNYAKTIVAPPHSGGATLEARWDEHGAVCIFKPRLVDPKLVKAACAIPTCNPLPSAAGTSEWQSFVPSMLKLDN